MRENNSVQGMMANRSQRHRVSKQRTRRWRRHRASTSPSESSSLVRLAAEVDCPPAPLPVFVGDKTPAVVCATTASPLCWGTRRRTAALAASTRATRSSKLNSCVDDGASAAPVSLPLSPPPSLAASLPTASAGVAEIWSAASSASQSTGETLFDALLCLHSLNTSSPPLHRPAPLLLRRRACSFCFEAAVR